LYVEVDRATAAAFGITPATVDQRALRLVRPAHRLDRLHPVEPVIASSWEAGPPRSQAVAPVPRLDSTCPRPVAARAGRSPSPPIRVGARGVGRRSRVKPPGAVPKPATVSFNLAPGRLPWARPVDAIAAAGRRTSDCPRGHGEQASRVPRSPFQALALGTSCFLILAAPSPRFLHHPGRALRGATSTRSRSSPPCPPPGVGRAAGPLMACHEDLGIIGIIGIILLIGHRGRRTRS